MRACDHHYYCQSYTPICYTSRGRYKLCPPHSVSSKRAAALACLSGEDLQPSGQVSAHSGALNKQKRLHLIEKEYRLRDAHRRGGPWIARDAETSYAIPSPSFLLSPCQPLGMIRNNLPVRMMTASRLGDMLGVLGKLVSFCDLHKCLQNWFRAASLYFFELCYLLGHDIWGLEG